MDHQSLFKGITGRQNKKERENVKDNRQKKKNQLKEDNLKHKKGERPWETPKAEEGNS